ncbi:hypothetical protein HanXRQr2_Chr17g0790501 [Helianthus annuus]|uniref:Uncharacterized protein n=2 Tax=Helianthus annuus TaxID=4232 RepID=A0A9K3DFE8_HELAN|nr:hypothetical protein HanXRQr2_Chr17g0790501 [Helianthus annuus]
MEHLIMIICCNKFLDYFTTVIFSDLYFCFAVALGLLFGPLPFSVAAWFAFWAAPFSRWPFSSLGSSSYSPAV